MHDTTRETHSFRVKPTTLILISLCTVMVFSLMLVTGPYKAGGNYAATAVSPYEYPREYTLPPDASEVRKNLQKVTYFEDNVYKNIVMLKNSYVLLPIYIPSGNSRDSINCISSLTGISGIKVRLSYQLLDKPPPYAASPC